MTELSPPFAILAELTHRCPLRCVYCSNPLELVRRKDELDTATWRRVFDEAAELGVLQVHFSGGEPTARKDLEELVAHATSRGLYTNLITSGVLSDADQLMRLADAGLAHVQISIQDSDDKTGDWIAGYDGAQQKKRELAVTVADANLALTINAVMHRHNIDRIESVIDMAVEMGAQRLEVANVQYYGWGIPNRPNLMPTLDQLDSMNEIVARRREELKGVLVIDYVVPDYYARRPKACMNGWARRFLNITPSGYVLPCHAAETIQDLVFDNVKDKGLADIWVNSSALNRFRGTDWMPEPCSSCEYRERDWGGCRCQALALTGSAENTDPVCELSPFHEQVRALAESESQTREVALTYRSFSNPLETA